MAGQWFALLKLFNVLKNEGYQVVRSDDEVIQFKNEQVFTLPLSLASTFLANGKSVMDVSHHPQNGHYQCSSDSVCHWILRLCIRISSG